MANNWTTAETNLLTYLRTGLSGTLDVNCFAPPDDGPRLNDYLPGFQDANLWMWTCWFEGGGDAADRGPSAALPYLRGTVTFRGFYLSRDKAQEHALAVAALLPVHNQVGPSSAAVSLWRHLYIATDPVIKLAVAHRKEDQAEKAGDVSGWMLDIIMDGGIKGA
jgi:hypothetical protein